MTPFRFKIVSALMVLIVGCNQGPIIYPVSGTVKYEDGSIPTGTMANIEFYPAVKDGNSQMASGSIEANGSFKLTTYSPEDGAQPGEYLVVFRVQEGLGGGRVLVAPEYFEPEKTPEKVTVKSGRNKFDFKIKKAT